MARVAPEGADPAEVVHYRESIRLAFVTALQHLPARQRAALILCEVLRWQVSEAAELLNTSVPAINSALQRARSTLRSLPAEDRSEPLDDADSELLARYVDAFERYDIDRLVTLVARRRGAVDAPVRHVDPGRGRYRALHGRARAEPVPGVAACWPPRPTAARPSGSTSPTPRAGTRRGRCRCLEISGGEITGMQFFLAFLDPERLFPAFGLPLHLDA